MLILILYVYFHDDCEAGRPGGVIGPLITLLIYSSGHESCHDEPVTGRPTDEYDMDSLRNDESVTTNKHVLLVNATLFESFSRFESPIKYLYFCYIFIFKH